MVMIIRETIIPFISAAFYMAEIKGMIVSLATLYNSPKELLKVLNSRMFLNADRKVFASMIYGVLDVKSNSFVFARAGHNPLLVKHDSKDLVTYMTPDGLGLGLDRKRIMYRSARTNWVWLLQMLPEKVPQPPSIWLK